MRIRVGTSGFSYSHWEESFYPGGLPSNRRLGHYAESLSTVELNGTFYRMPDPEQLRRWAAMVPEDFRFCLKAHRVLTYSGARFDKPAFARDFRTRIQALGNRIGPVLLQFAPARQRDDALLAELLLALEEPAAVEFRHESWFAEDVYELLAAHGAALVVTDEEAWPMAPALALGRFAYYRLRRDYDDSEIGGWAARIRAASSEADDVYVFFKHFPQAPRRALLFARLLDANG